MCWELRRWASSFCLHFSPSWKPKIRITIQNCVALCMREQEIKSVLRHKHEIMKKLCEWRGQEMSVVVSTREKRSSWSWFIVDVARAVFCSHAPSLKPRHRATSHLLTKSSFATQHISVERNPWYSIVLFHMEKNTDGSVQHYSSFGPNKFQIKKIAMRLVAKCTTWFTGLDLCLILVSFHLNWLRSKLPNIWCFFFFLLAMHYTFSVTCE